MPTLFRAVAVLGVTIVVVASAAFVGNGIGAAVPSPVPATRVKATPPPTPEPTAVPQQATAPVRRAAPRVCPQLTNPGGGLVWTASADAGPWPTGGSVTLPSLGVSAPIVEVGVSLRNEMVVPPNARDVAWLSQGTFPGWTNNAVLAGHVKYSGRSGTFSRIGNLREGDAIVVEMDGRRYEFRVTWTCSFDRDTHLADQIMGRTLVPSVTLITCGGTFDRRAGTHTNRTVVRAELVSVA